MSWLYVPGLAGSNLESNSPIPPLEPSVMWRGKPFLPRSWYNAWRKGTWIRHLSGLTFEPSTAAHGMELWISSLRDSRANPSALPESYNEKTIHGTFGLTSPESFESASRLSSSSRTSRPEPFLSLGETFEQWASKCRTPSRVPPPSWVRGISGKGSSYLPTPAARDWREDRVYPSQLKRHSPNLGTQIGGQVNPLWKEWFMGLPIGWTAIEPLEMQSYQRWLRSHSDL